MDTISRENNSILPVAGVVLGVLSLLIGGYAAIKVKRAGEAEFRTFTEAFGTVSPSKFTNIVLHGGDEVLIEAPGGGGYGAPPPDSAC